MVGSDFLILLYVFVCVCVCYAVKAVVLTIMSESLFACILYADLNDGRVTRKHTIFFYSPF